MYLRLPSLALDIRYTAGMTDYLNTCIYRRDAIYRVWICRVCHIWVSFSKWDAIGDAINRVSTVSIIFYRSQSEYIKQSLRIGIPKQSLGTRITPTAKINMHLQHHTLKIIDNSILKN